MKVAPLAAAPGTLGSAEVGRTANPVKLERARAIARGDKVIEETTGDEQADRVKPNVRSIKMRTQVSTDREMPPEANLEEQVVTEKVEGEALSSTSESNEQATVEATQPLSPQFAALAKQKRALQVKERELADREKALQTGSVTDNAPDLIARLKSQPLSVLQEHGVTYDQLTEAILSEQNGIHPEIQALKAELKALKEGVDKTFITKEEQAEEAALTEMLFEAEGLAKEGEAYEMIREQNAYDQVLRLIHKTYKETGRVLDTAEAMETIEVKLLQDAEKLARIKKVQSRIAPEPIQPLQQQQNKQMRTLTARDTAKPQMDRRARALAAFQGTLKR